MSEEIRHILDRLRAPGAWSKPMCPRTGAAPDGTGIGANWKPIWNCPAAGRPVRKTMNADKITDLLVARLVRDHGRSKHHWRKVIGPIRLYSRATHPHCNWTATPTGSFQEIAVIESLLDDLRMRHPLIIG